jgi:hypothetical protein
MLSRRELLTAGVAGGLSPAPITAATATAEQQPADREGQREIARNISQVEGILRQAFQTSSLSHGFVAKIRALMEQFLRANQKFPDFFDVGLSVFFDVYDWHVKNRQQLLCTRQADGRYTMQFMFSTLIMRPEQDPNYISYPYDKG